MGTDCTIGYTSWRELHGLEGGESGIDAEILAEATRNTGAVVLGKRMYDLADGWRDNPPVHVPVFVLTHDAQSPWANERETKFNFVTYGVEMALWREKAAEGEMEVPVAAGASVI